MSTATAMLPHSSLDHCSMMMMMMTITEAAAGLCSLHALEIKDHKKLPNKHPFLLFAGKPAVQKTKLLSRDKNNIAYKSREHLCKHATYLHRLPLICTFGSPLHLLAAKMITFSGNAHCWKRVVLIESRAGACMGVSPFTPGSISNYR